MAGPIKPIVGLALLTLCDALPALKAPLRRLGLRTKKEWFAGRTVRVQTPAGRAFKLASVAGNYLSFELFWRGTVYYEPITTLVAETLAGGCDLFLDAGANIGFYSLVLATACPALRIAAFEPHPRLFALLAANVRANAFDRIACEPLALSDRTGALPLHLSASDMSASLQPDFEDAHAGTLEIRATTLDAWLARFAPPVAPKRSDGGPRLLLKLDVEGHEAAVLAGARATLAAHRPDIIAEAAAQFGQPATLEFLRALGYRCYQITDCGFLPCAAPAPVVRGSLVFLNCLLSARDPAEIAALHARLAPRIRSLDLAATSKNADAQNRRRLRARQAIPAALALC